MGGCSVRIRDGSRVRTIRVAAGKTLSLDVILSLSKDEHVAPELVEGHRATTLRKAQGDNANVLDERGSAAFPGQRAIVLLNDRVRFAIDPDAGARAFSFTASSGTSPNAFDATGSLRDDVSDPIPPSRRDYIARYTHGYPAGTFNRPYEVQILSSGPSARVRFSYTMPDARPSGVRFERIVSLEPHASRVVVDERLVLPDGSDGSQRVVLRSSLPPLMGTPLDAFSHATATALPSGSSAIGGYRDGFAFVVAWRPDDVEAASWTPYRSTGTLALTLVPGWRRIVYAYAPAASVEAGRAFLEAERGWVAANRPDERP
jgi:hypothetical protein